MYERTRPSIVLVILSLIPLALIFSVFHLTEFFSVKPSLPPFYHALLPLFILAMSAIISVFSYFTARDEEPEWGPVLPFKVIEGVSISYIVTSIVLASLVVVMYFLP